LVENITTLTRLQLFLPASKKKHFRATFDFYIRQSN